MNEKMLLNKEIDFIGDIHGHADTLSNLLLGIGYKKVDGTYKHESRKMFFIGDYIDRGPKIRETLQIVKGMCDAGEAFALMGNHEYNAICFHTNGIDGKPLREHSEKNIKQHERTLDEFSAYPDEWKMYLTWFKSLPLYFENDYFRAVHACWDKKHIQQLINWDKNSKEDNDFLIKSSTKKIEENNVVEEVLKGKEVYLEGESFIDKDGKRREEGRIKWWKASAGLKARDFIFEYPGLAPNFKINFKNDAYPTDDKPVFFGHYWLKGNQPELMAKNVCCLDYSVAKHGMLCAYKWNGERVLDSDNFVWMR